MYVPTYILYSTLLYYEFIMLTIIYMLHKLVTECTDTQNKDLRCYTMYDNAVLYWQQK